MESEETLNNTKSTLKIGMKFATCHDVLKTKE